MVEFKATVEPTNLSVLSKLRHGSDHRHSEVADVARPDQKSPANEIKTEKTSKGDLQRDNDHVSRSAGYFQGEEANHKLRELFIKIYEDIGYAPTMAQQRVDSFIGEFPPRIQEGIYRMDERLVESGVAAPDMSMSIRIEDINFETHRTADGKTAFKVDNVIAQVEARDGRGHRLVAQPMLLEVGQEGAIVDADGRVHHGIVAKTLDSVRKETGQKAQEDPFQQTLARTFGEDRVIQQELPRGTLVKLNVDQVVAVDRSGDGGRQDGGQRDQGDQPPGRQRNQQPAPEEPPLRHVSIEA